MSGRLTTHVLDTARGRPAAGIPIELARIDGDRREVVATATTNADGRTDAPLLSGDRLDVGVYELVFHVGGAGPNRGRHPNNHDQIRRPIRCRMHMSAARPEATRRNLLTRAPSLAGALRELGLLVRAFFFWRW